MIDSVVEALTAAKPRKVLCLSTIGADAVHDNLLSQRTMMEAALGELPLPLTILRPAWFIDNAAWDVASARETGLIHSFLHANGQGVPDGCRKGRWAGGGEPHSGGLDRHARCRAGGPLPGNAERPRRRLRERHRKAGACGAGAPRVLG